MQLQVSCNKFTVYCEIDESNIIRKTAPITRKFIGQPLNNLLNWFNMFGGLKIYRLDMLNNKMKPPSFRFYM